MFLDLFTLFSEQLMNLIINYLQVRLEHIIERVALISDAANTERPSLVVNNLFIGGALAARSKYTLQQLGITHVLCLCSNEIGQSDSQFPDLFEYKNFSVRHQSLLVQDSIML
jgi:atypical dual specificity phosphatase